MSIGITWIGWRKPRKKETYYANKIKEVKGDIKKTLACILNKITNKVHNKNNAIDVRECDGSNVTDGKTTCDILNDHLCTVGIKIVINAK